MFYNCSYIWFLFKNHLDYYLAVSLQESQISFVFSFLLMKSNAYLPVSWFKKGPYLCLPDSTQALKSFLASAWNSFTYSFQAGLELYILVLCRDLLEVRRDSTILSYKRHNSIPCCGFLQLISQHIAASLGKSILVNSIWDWKEYPLSSFSVKLDQSNF